MKYTGKPPRSRSAKPAGKAPGKSAGKPFGKPSGKTFKTPSRDEPRRGRHSSQKDSRTDAKRDDKRGGRNEFKGKPEFRDRPDRNKGSDSRPVRDASPRPQRAERPVRVREPRAPRESRSSLGPRANMFGLHAVKEAILNPKRSIHAIYLTDQTAMQFAAIMEHAHKKGLIRPEPKILSKDDFERLLGRDVVHQGAALSAAPQEEAFIQDILSIAANKERSVILVLDQVTDPHNVGAILRSACAFGADGVVMQRRHAPDLDGIVAKTASGAAEHIPVAYETNLSRTLEELAEAGYTAIGLDEHSETSLSEVKVPAKAVLVLGAEGDGMRRLIKEHCDVLVTLPTQMPIASLNVSNAAAVALYALLK